MVISFNGCTISTVQKKYECSITKNFALLVKWISPIQSEQLKQMLSSKFVRAF